MSSVALDAYNESTTDLSGTLVDILLQLIATQEGVEFEISNSEMHDLIVGLKYAHHD